MNRNKNTLEDQLDELKHRNSTIEKVNADLKTQNERMQKFISENSSSSSDITVDNLDAMVYPKDPYSQK